MPTIPPIPLKLIIGLVGGALAAVAVFLMVHEIHHWKAKAEATQTQLVQSQAALTNTVQNYRTAATQAAQADAANVARVQAEQASVNERTSSEYENRIAAVTAEYRRLQQSSHTTAANPSGPRAAPVPVVSTGTSGTPPAPQQAQLSADDAFTATKQAVQLDELIKWVERQSAVNVKGTE